MPNVRNRHTMPLILRCLLLLALASVHAAVPAILDTDIGTFMDDSFALAQTLLSPGIDLRLLVTSSHDTIGRARVAAKYLTTVGAVHVPIGIGVQTDDEQGPLFGWAADYNLSLYPGGVYADGVAAMRRAIEDCRDEQMVLIEIGPHTNVKHLLERFPHLQERVRLFVMGGSIVPGIRLPWGHVTPVNTTNERIDPEAARAMLHSQWATAPVFAPIATTYNIVINGSMWQRLTKSPRHIVQTLLVCYMYWWQESLRNTSWITHGEALSLDPTKGSNILFDTEAVHLALSGEWLVMTEANVDFSPCGRTLVLPSSNRSGTKALFALNWTKHGHARSGLDMYLSHLVGILLDTPLQPWEKRPRTVEFQV